jgi:hypothetical protein
VTQKLVDIQPEEGDHPLIKLPADVVEWMRGRPQPPLYNAYICRRRPAHIIICVDIHPGVTPMFLSCRDEHCDSDMVSAGYPGERGAGPLPDRLRDKPLWVWYRMSEPELRKANDMERAHVLQGGLKIRRCPQTLAQFEAEWARHGQ